MRKVVPCLLPYKSIFYLKNLEHGRQCLKIRWSEKKLEVAKSDFCTDFFMNSADFLMNNAYFLEIGGGSIRHISPKFGKIGRICKP
jgi:hypothetical protein